MKRLALLAAAPLLAACTLSTDGSEATVTATPHPAGDHDDAAADRLALAAAWGSISEDDRDTICASFNSDRAMAWAMMGEAARGELDYPTFEHFFEQACA